MLVDRNSNISLADKGCVGTFAALRRSRQEFVNWWWLLPVAALVVPSRLWPKHGFAMLEKCSVTLRLRSGASSILRLNEVYAWFEVFGRGVYEAENIQWDKVQSIVDVGANTGASCFWFLEQSDAACVLAIEPAMDTKERLIANLNRNGFLDRVRVFRFAVGADSGSGYVVQGNSSVTAQVSAEPGMHGEQVAFLGLDEIVQLAGGKVDLMKLDCEGGEYGLLSNASFETLAKIGSIIGEYHPRSKTDQTKMFERLEGSGFHCQITPDGFIDGLEQGIFYAWKRK